MRDEDKIKWPGRARGSKVEKALVGVPKDGEPHRILTMGLTVAEQTARGYNVEGGRWIFGYTLENNDKGELVSVLWAKWDG